MSESKSSLEILADLPLRRYDAKTGEFLEEVTYKTLWQPSKGYDKVIVKMMRRFGCPLCRHAVGRLNKARPLLDSLGIAVAVVGLEEYMMDDFVARGFWKGDHIYVDEGKQGYKDLGLKVMGFWDSGYGLLDKSTIAAYKKANSEGADSPTMNGDGMQLGATFVIQCDDDKPSLLQEYRMVNYADEIQLPQILEDLGHDAKETMAKFDLEMDEEDGGVKVCSSDFCEL